MAITQQDSPLPSAELPPQIEELLARTGFVPTPMCHEILRLASRLSWLKRDRPGEVSCSGVFFAALTLVTTVEDLNEYVPPSLDKIREAGELEALSAITNDIQNDRVTWDNIISEMLAYHGNRTVYGFKDATEFNFTSQNATHSFPSSTLVGALLSGRSPEVTLGSSSLDMRSLLTRVISEPDTSLRRRLSRAGVDPDALRQILDGSDGDVSPRQARSRPDGPAAASTGFERDLLSDGTSPSRLLGSDVYAAAVATVFRTAQGEFCFGLLGPWGIGKTHLARRIADHLATPQDYKKEMAALAPGLRKLDHPDFDTPYDVVWHSAWKFRRTPEAWIFLYEAMAAGSCKGVSVVTRLGRALRTGVSRCGYWRLVLSLMIIGLVAIPLSALGNLLIAIGGMLGLVNLLYLAGLFRRMRQTVESLGRRYAMLTRHGERLGMQALIGDDLRALVTGWVPRVWVEKDSKREERDAFAAMPWPMAILALAVVGMFWLSTTWVFPESLAVSATAVLKQQFGWACGVLLPNEWPFCASATPTPRSTGWLELGVFVLWCAACIAILLMVHGTGREPRRILLVIDDLDRCSPGEVIELAESLKLLLEDPAVCQRVQVMMLLDEDVFEHAICEKFRPLLEHRVKRAGNASEDTSRREIIAEHVEKILISYLRLPTIGSEEIAILADKYSKVDFEKWRQAKIGSLKREAASDPEIPKPTQRQQQTETVLVSSGRRPYIWRPGIEEGVEPPKKETRVRSAETVEEFAERLKKWEADVAAQRQRQSRREAELARLQGPGNGSAPPPGNAPADDPTLSDLQLSDLRFSEYEIGLIRRKLPDYMAAGGRRPSPRAVRLFLFKYQLGRSLLQLNAETRALASTNEGLEQFLDALGAACFTIQTHHAAPTGRATVAGIVSQIA